MILVRQDLPVVELSADPIRNRRVAEEILRALPQWFGLEECVVSDEDGPGSADTFNE